MDFPEWFENGRVIGKNPDGEELAVGLGHGRPWLVRRSSLTGIWTSCREATPEEVAKYDKREAALLGVKID